MLGPPEFDAFEEDPLTVSQPSNVPRANDL